MKKRLLSIVFALLMLCQLLSFSILAEPAYDDPNEVPGQNWENPVYYTVTLPTDPVGYTITAGDTEVMAGESFSFTVTVATGYKKGDNFAVLANDVDVTSTGVNDVYTITVTGDVEIKVEGVEAEATVMIGDVNGNGKINAQDVTLLYKAVLAKTAGDLYPEAGDINDNGEVNAQDVTLLYKAVLTKTTDSIQR